MATKRVIYFTKDVIPTGPELADIQKLNDYAEPPLVVLIANSSANALYGEEKRRIPADYVSGTVPDDYKEEGTEVYPVLDPDTLPDLPSNQYAISNGQSFPDDGGNGTIGAAVADNVPTLTFTPGDERAIVSDGETLTAEDGDGTIEVSIASGNAEYTFVPDEEKALVENEQELPLYGTDGTTPTATTVVVVVTGGVLSFKTKS